MSSDSIAITAHQLGKTYHVFDRPLDRLKQSFFRGSRNYGREFHALSDVSFSLPRGQVMGLVGNNGAGKSTLLQLVCQTLKPTSGQLQVKGRVAALLELGAGFNPEFSGRENIYLNAAVLGLTRKEIEQRYEDIVEFSGIRDFIEQPVKTYSSGMYVRLAFSIATSIDPDILIIDEALSVGDGAFARKSFDRIMELKARGATILFCSHSMYQIEAICDQAIWLEHGKVVMLGKPQEVTKTYIARMEAATLPSPNLKKEPVVNTNLSALTSGRGQLLQVSVSADGVTGNRLTITAGVSELRVYAQFKFDPTLATPSIAFGIETLTGVPVTSGSTVFDKVQPHVIGVGAAEVTLKFPRIHLMHGKYRFSIYLGCENCIHLYDQALYCTELEVLHQGIEQGYCFLQRAWNDGPLTTVTL